MKTLRMLTIGLLTALALFGSVSFTHADTNPDGTCASATFCPLANVQGSRLQDVYANTGSLSDFLNKMFTMALSVGAILAVLRLGYAGYEYMVSDNWGNKHHAREIIGEVVLGLLLLLSCWLILYQINPQILSLDVLKSLGAVKSNAPAPATPTAPLPQEVQQAIGGVGGAANIQRNADTGQCYILNPNTGGQDPTTCP